MYNIVTFTIVYKINKSIYKLYLYVYYETLLFLRGYFIIGNYNRLENKLEYFLNAVNYTTLIKHIHLILFFVSLILFFSFVKRNFRFS